MTRAAASRRPGGPPAGLTRETILQAADTFDADELSMSRLATALGVTHSALYHWFPNKQAIIAELAASALHEVQLPLSTGHWREDVVAAATAMRDVLWSRRRFLPHLAASVASAATPLSLRILEALHSAGSTEDDAVATTELICAWCFYSACQASYFDEHEMSDEDSMNEYLDGMGVGHDSPLRRVVSRYSNRSPETIFIDNLNTLLNCVVSN